MKRDETRPENEPSSNPSARSASERPRSGEEAERPLTSACPSCGATVVWRGKTKLGSRGGVCQATGKPHRIAECKFRQCEAVESGGSETCVDCGTYWGEQTW